MKEELRHYAYSPTIGGRSVPAHNLINNLGKHALFYIGTFSENNILGAWMELQYGYTKKPPNR